MANSTLPERASLEFLKRRAKELLPELRRTNPQEKLAAAQLAVAREYGFASWRALKVEIDQRRAPALAAFFAACRAGDDAALTELLAREPGLVREQDAEGSTGLHRAVGHASTVRLLLAHGADPNARDVGDNATALHFAAGGNVESVRALLDAGADVHGFGDVHRQEVIGWAVCSSRNVPWDVLALLLERGARHHIFSAIAVQDAELIERLVEENPAALARRLSRFEQGQTALHYALFAPDGLTGGGFRNGAHYAIAEHLIELGAEVDAEDDKGRTPLAIALLKGDHGAIQLLREAGAKEPAKPDAAALATSLAELAPSVKKLDVMLNVKDIRKSIRFYEAIGFTLKGTHENDGRLDFAAITFGGAYLMMVPGDSGSHKPLSLWVRVERIDEIYALLKARALERAGAVRAEGEIELRFTEDLYDTHYGMRIFTLEDPDGYGLIFSQALPA
jgi:ankyrin repeat protein/catechol 2,3-dioxygenase-like lactoylglutathione lyase family enzyme